MILRKILFAVAALCISVSTINAMQQTRQPDRIQINQTLKTWGFSDDDINNISLPNPLDPLNDPRFDFSGRGFEALLVQDYAGARLSSLSEADYLLVIPALLEAGYDPNVLINRWPILFHFIASNSNYPRVIQLLLSSERVDRNYRTENNMFGQTALTVAANHNDAESRLALMQLLLERCEHGDHSALTIAQDRKNSKLTEMLRQHERQWVQMQTSSGSIPLPAGSIAPSGKKPAALSPNDPKIPGMPQDVLKEYGKKYGPLKHYIKKYGPWGLVPVAAAAFVYLDYKVSKAFPNTWLGRRWQKNEKRTS